MRAYMHNPTGSLLKRAVLASVLCLSAAVAFAQESNGTERHAENRRRWMAMSETQREAIRRRARQIAPEELDQLRARFARFKNLPHQDRERVRANHARFTALRSGRRAMLRTRFQRFRSLPEERRNELRRRFRERRTGRPWGTDSDSTRRPDPGRRFPGSPEHSGNPGDRQDVGARRERAARGRAKWTETFPPERGSTL